RPFLLIAMVVLAASVSLRFFRFGGVPQMVLSGIAAGFLLYVLSKVTEDLSKAELMHPMAAAWLPGLVGALIGFMILLHQEGGGWPPRRPTPGRRGVEALASAPLRLRPCCRLQPLRGSASASRSLRASTRSGSEFPSRPSRNRAPCRRGRS